MLSILKHVGRSRNTSSFQQQGLHEAGAIMQRSLHKDKDLDTEISFCKTPVVDEKLLT